MSQRRLVHAGVALLATAGVIAAGTTSASAGTAKSTTFQQSLNTLVSTDKFPAALATVRYRDGRTRQYTAGVSDLSTQQPVKPDGQVRIGSNTKTFTAVAVLQLVGEGRINLEAPVDTYLPGVVRGDGIDGRHITVHELLQHTSGLPEYSTAIVGSDYFAIQHRHFEPQELLDAALSQKAHFAPGTKWEYSNTNYILAGMIVERVTGQSLSEVITDRVIRRAGLRHTYFPAPGDESIAGPHPHGYFANKPGDPLRDVTVMDPSWAWAAGQIISTNSDMNAFFTALFGGRLLKPQQLREMKQTVPAETDVPNDTRDTQYGLGLFRRNLSCGGVYWGHGGDIPGYETRGGVSDSGRAVNVALTEIPDNITSYEHVLNAVDAAFCS